MFLLCCFKFAGRLYSALKQHDDAIILLDEVEKAHPNVFTVLLNVFDSGVLRVRPLPAISCYFSR